MKISKTKLWSIIQEATVQWIEAPERADKVRGKYKERNNKDFWAEKHECLDWRKKEGRNTTMPETLSAKWLTVTEC